MVTIEDLQQVCSHCSGSGFIQDWQWVQWWAENDDVPPDGHPLHKIQEEVPCEKCNEVGYVPTELGRVFLEFMNHFRGRK